mgnify:CR=1 FL=1
MPGSPGIDLRSLLRRQPSCQEFRGVQDKEVLIYAYNALRQNKTIYAYRGFPPHISEETRWGDCRTPRIEKDRDNPHSWWEKFEVWVCLEGQGEIQPARAPAGDEGGEVVHSVFSKRWRRGSPRNTGIWVREHRPTYYTSGGSTMGGWTEKLWRLCWAVWRGCLRRRRKYSDLTGGVAFCTVLKAG